MNDLPGATPDNARGTRALPETEMGKEICFPKSALALSGEGEDVLPEDGEEVTVEVAGKIRIAGEMVYLTPETVNGETVGKGEEEKSEGEDTPASMEEMARQLDQEG